MLGPNWLTEDFYDKQFGPQREQRWDLIENILDPGNIFQSDSPANGFS